MRTSFSSILAGAGRRVSVRSFVRRGGLVFGTGTTIPLFHASGNVLCEIEHLKIVARGPARKEANSEYILLGMLSHPDNLMS